MFFLAYTLCTNGIIHILIALWILICSQRNISAKKVFQTALNREYPIRMENWMEEPIRKTIHLHAVCEFRLGVKTDLNQFTDSCYGQNFSLF